MTSDENRGVTTGQLLQRLQRLGLPASQSSIDADTADHYLPPRETSYMGRHGISGIWQPWMVERAERLYRLRLVNRRSNTGPTGDVLRLFLFLADGWGWRFVKASCVEGYRLHVIAATRGVKNRLRSPLTPTLLPIIAEDVATDQYRPETPTPDQIDRVQQSVALLAFGVASGGSIGTLASILEFIAQGDLRPQQLADAKELAPLAWSLIDPSQANATEVADNAGEETIRATIGAFRSSIFFLRRAHHQSLKSLAAKKGACTNPLSCFGVARDPHFPRVLRSLPVRITPAQLLGAQFLSALIAEAGMPSLAPWFTRMFLMHMLQSRALEQALQETERKL